MSKRKELPPADFDTFMLPDDDQMVQKDISKWSSMTHTIRKVLNSVQVRCNKFSVSKHSFVATRCCIVLA